MGEYADAYIDSMIDGWHGRGGRRRHQPRKPPIPMCPKCGKQAVRSDTQYGSRYDCCGLTAWGRKPLTDTATRKAREYAHKVFDAVWHGLNLSRGEAYRRLAKKMGLAARDCHMANMTREQAEAVPAMARAIYHEEMGRRAAKRQ